MSTVPLRCGPVRPWDAVPGSYARSSCHRASTVYSTTSKSTYLTHPCHWFLALHHLALPRRLEHSPHWGASSSQLSGDLVLDTTERRSPPFYTRERVYRPIQAAKV